MGAKEMKRCSPERKLQNSAGRHFTGTGYRCVAHGARDHHSRPVDLPPPVGASELLTEGRGKGKTVETLAL